MQPIAVTAVLGDAGSLGYAMSSGHWYPGPDQAVVPKRLLTALHARVGETVTITGGGHAIPVRIVGEVFVYGAAQLAALALAGRVFACSLTGPRW